LPDADALVVADTHVGMDAASDVEFPLGERGDLHDRIGALLDRFDPGEVVVAGDVLHAFDRVPDPVADSLATIRRTVERADSRLALVRGNHDTMLDSLAVDVVDAHRLDDGSVVVHGHEEPTPEADRYLIGHDHPTIRIEGVKRPCYLAGPDAYRGADVLMLPAFNRLAAGTVVNAMRGRDFQSPLVDATDPLRPTVRDEATDTTHRFPPLGEFRRLL
ncbi:metallophosphoesterase, partial [Halobacteriales archaeon SW_7_68_16]